MTATAAHDVVDALAPLALAATRAAALACEEWVGRGDAHAADAAATEAMRTVLAGACGRGTVIVGEGAKDAAPMLYDGESFGAGDGPAFDIAVDPLECTKLCAKGLGGSLATIAFAPEGTMARLAASHYMEKLVGAPVMRDVLDLRVPVEATVRTASEVLRRPVRVVVLDKPRHERLIARLRAAGAVVSTPPDGDVAGALAALLPATGSDLLMGIGGTPEGVMSACAVRALGGFMQARLAPQRDHERRAMMRAGLDAERVYELDELAGDGLFAATGVTDGPLVERQESIVIGAGAAQRVPAR